MLRSYSDFHSCYKMKTLFLFVCVFAVVFGHATFRLPDNEIRNLKQVHDSCQSDRLTYCDENLLRKLVDNQGNKQVGIHMLCMAEKAGLMQHSGSLNIETIKKKVALGAKPGSPVDGLVKKCAVSKSSAEITAVQLWICFVQNDIHYYHRL